MAAKKIHKLNYFPDYSFLVFGITSDEKDYKLIFDINNFTGWNLTRQENYRFFNRKTGEEAHFPLFSFTDEDSYINYKLIANKYENRSLLEELRNLDYIFLVFDESGYEDLSSLPENLKKIRSIRAVFSIDPSKLKEKDRLVF